MGHAHHFLSRLDRVSMPQVELALSLYRDEELLRFVFERARIPEAVEKVAISLDHPEQGPFVIVTRSGRFVTCLGAGMKTKDDQPIITKGQLEAFAAKAEDLKNRMAKASALAQGRGVNALLRRIYDAGDELSREDFIAVSALHPLYSKQFLGLHFDGVSFLQKGREVFLPILKKAKKLKPAYHEAMHAYWQTFWSMSNFLVLAAMNDTLDECFLELASEMTGKVTPTWGTTRQGLVPVALQGAWVAGRLGKPLLGDYKRFYQNALTYLQTVDSGIALLALGFRHSRLRAEVEKALGAEVPDRVKGTALGNWYAAIRRLFMTIATAERKGSDYFYLVQTHMGAHRWIDATRHLPPGPFRFSRIEDVPEDLARTYAIKALIPFTEDMMMKKSDLLLFMLQMIPWVARAPAENLYLPRDVIKVVHGPWTPDHTLAILRPMVDKGFAPQPETVSRQGLCPCGSGKKYKRCCEEKDKAKRALKDADDPLGDEEDSAEESGA